MSTRTRALRASFCILTLVALLVTGGGFRAAAMQVDAATAPADAALQTFALETVVAAASYNGVPGQAASYSPSRAAEYRLYAPWLDLDSTLFVQNTAASPGTVMLELYDSVGGGTYTQITTIEALGSWVLDLATLASLPPGFQGGAVLLSDQPLAAVVNGQRSIGSLYSYACGPYGAAQVVLPDAMKDYYGYNADIWIQNTGSTPVDVDMTFYLYSGGAVYTHVDSGIDPGRSRLYRTADMSGLPSAYYGWVLVTASGPVTAASMRQDSVHLSTMASRGTDLLQADTTLVSPRQQRDVSFATVLNPTPYVAELLASWYTTMGMLTWSQAVSVAPLATYNLNTFSLPADFDGSLLLESDQPVTGLANWSGTAVGAAGIASSPAVGLSSLTTVSYQPRVVHSETLGKNTELSVLNAGSAPAEVTFTYHTPSGTEAAVFNIVLETNGVRRFSTADVTGLGDEWVGSATVSSTQPIAVEVMQFLHKLVVDSTADSGNGTLREALSVAEGGDTIIFDPEVFPVASPATIALTSGPLPDISQGNLTVDASFSSVILDGSALAVGDGLHIISDGNVIRGLQILNFPGAGIQIDGGASDNLIGGSNTTPGGICSGDCNVISGNGNQGINIWDSGATGNTVSGNYIGTGVTGTAAVPNAGYWGVGIGGGAQYNQIGGDSPEARNLISGNLGNGIEIQGAGTMSNTVSGNYIGTDVSGMATLPNGHSGVSILWGAQQNTVGGSLAGEGNLVSANTHNGIAIAGTGTMGNSISGNYLGVDASGTGALGNSGNGIWIAEGASGNVVGGTTASDRNIISGHVYNGIHLDGAGTVGNTVAGNYIGTDASGMAAVSNGADGILLTAGAHDNLIGGTSAEERNVISGNGSNGVTIRASGTMSNTVSGNYIGTDASGAIVVANGGHGISLGNGSRYNVIGGQNATPGGACTGECNLISGNTAQGVCLDYSDVMSNTISGNYIGTDVTGSIALPNRGGVWIGHGAQHNTVGGDRALGEGNLLSGNLIDGVNLQRDGTMYNQIIGNDIGITADGTSVLGNGARGVDITLAAQHNVVGGTANGEVNVIRGNGADGVYVDGINTLYNTVTRNTIYDNAGLGIDLANGGNAELPSPAIVSYDLVAGTAAGTACPDCTVELFSDEEDEGRWFEASTVADGSGAWNIDKGSAFNGPALTATATDAEGNTSEFGQLATTWLNLDVDLQGRADDSGALFTAWAAGQDAGSCTSGQDGTCSIPVASGTYSVTAEMASYLDSVWDTVSIGEGESATLPTVTLLGGDTNDDCVINIQDLAFMGYRFNACEGDPLYDVRGDINGDGCINILDLAMAGGNFNRACPVPW